MNLRRRMRFTGKIWGETFLSARAQPASKAPRDVQRGSPDDREPLAPGHARPISACAQVHVARQC
jgi:hypothetical protein